MNKLDIIPETFSCEVLNIPEEKDFSGGDKKRTAVIKLEGKSPDFGKTANDYAKYRHGFPDEFFIKLKEKNIILPGKTLIDIGTGTGTIARGAAKYGCTTYAIDKSEILLNKAREITKNHKLKVIYKVGLAEKTGMANQQFDIITVGQAWHWFNHDIAIPEIRRIIKPSGTLVIGHFDWLPFKASVPNLSESLISKFNPRWKGANGTGFYPEWAMQLSEAGFTNIETYTFEKIITYSHEAWQGRIRASAGVAASLSIEEVEQFDIAHAKILKQNFPELLLHVPHRCFTLIAKPPSPYSGKA